jgi:hypothetical protein
MKNSKSTITMKAGKTKSAASVPDKQHFAQLKQQIKDAKLRLQSAKRVVREAKDSLKRAKHIHKMAKKAAAPASTAPKAKMKLAVSAIKKPVKKTVKKKTTAATKQPKASITKAVKAKAAMPVKLPQKSDKASAKPAGVKVEMSSQPARLSAPVNPPRKKVVKPAAAAAVGESTEPSAPVFSNIKSAHKLV